jgi:probable rRNA maturation factor
MPLLVTLTNASGLRYRGRDLIIGRAEKALLKEGVKHGRVDIILLNDNDLRKLHRQWMGENTVTDVITFPLIEEPPIHAEIYISVSRARAQAEEYGVTLTNELCRLAVHGALHIAGYDDATEDQRKRMHELENRYIGRV